MICSKCGKRYKRSESEAVFNGFFDGDEDFNFHFENEPLCPEHTYEACQEIGSNRIGFSDAEDIYYSSGEDEDYDFR